MQHSDLPGFNQQQQDVLVTLVQNCRKRMKGPFNTGRNLISREQVLHLCVLLRLAVLLHHKRQSHFVPHINATAKGKRITLAFPKDWLADKPAVRLALEIEQGYFQEQGLSLLIESM